MSKLEQIANVLNTRDGEGHAVTFNPSTGDVHFAQNGHNPRFIGKVEEEDGVIFYRKNEREEHIYRKSTAWSINNEVLRLVDKVVYTSQKAVYTISKSDAYTFGEFSKKNITKMDLKVLVPIKHWSVELIDPPEESREQMRINRLGYEWFSVLKDELDEDYMVKLNEVLLYELDRFNIAPKMEDVFNAYKHTQLNDVKVVILGQDPYHTPGVAHGLSFSTNKPQTNPPSLKNILAEIERDAYEGFKLDSDTDLTRLADQGVFLLNTVLTVRHGEPNSHKGIGWETFTRRTIEILNEKRKHIVYMLWGNQAQEFESIIDPKENLVLTTTHPSPFSAHKGFVGCGHFSAANEYLLKTKQTIINW